MLVLMTSYSFLNEILKDVTMNDKLPLHFCFELVDDDDYDYLFVSA